ncbi:MAG TPA: hypothetical protein VIL78_17360 [Hanamia sp.]
MEYCPVALVVVAVLVPLMVTVTHDKSSPFPDVTFPVTVLLCDIAVVNENNSSRKK